MAEDQSASAISHSRKGTELTVIPWAVETRGLTKAFGRQWALRGIDLRVRPGETVALFGPNGAGKTTLLRIIAGLTRATSGEVRLEGLDPREEPVEARRRIGMISHQTFLYDDLTAEENLRFYGRMYDVPNLDERIEFVLDLLGVAHRRHDRVRTLSRGLQQRVSIARAVLHDPSILLLDEPDTGLDQYAAEVLSNLLHSLRQGQRTVILTTHNLERGLEMSQRAIILVQGKIVYDAPKETLAVDAFKDTYDRYTVARGRAPSSRLFA